MSALTKVKDKPLLEQPGQRRWWDITAGDCELIRGYVQRGNLITTDTDADTLFYAIKLGLRDDVSERWKEYVGKMMGQHRKYERWTDLAKKHYMIKELGLREVILGQSEVPEIDVKMISGRPKGTGSMGTTMATAYYVKELGLPLTITDADKEEMRYELESDWINLDPLHRAEAFAHLKKLGLLEEISGSPKVRDEDMEEMRKQLNEFRRDGKGWAVAMMHYIIRLILQPEEAQSQQPMPPIKRFGK